MDLYGRTVIYTDVEEIDRTNIFNVLQSALNVHNENVSQMETLIDYYRGEQAIYEREKTIRPDINYQIVENRCKEVVDFKKGYAIGDPIQYNDRTGNKNEQISELNTIMDYEGRNHVDEMTVEWNLITGLGYKGCFLKDEPDEISTIEIYSFDPRQTFVIYSSGFRHEPMASVWFVTDSENNTRYTVYTKDKGFIVLNNDTIEDEFTNEIGEIPIVEYPCNNSRMGAFESVMDLQDALNIIDSDRVNANAQFVQSLIVAVNCNFEDTTTSKDIMQSGIVRLTSDGGVNQDIKVLTQELNQSQTETLKQDIYQSMLTICAMPNRNGGSSTSDTGIAVVYRDGWSAAETWEKGYEVVYKRSERQFLKVCCAAFAVGGGPDLVPSDISTEFTRKNYENIASKVQVLTEMLNNPYIAKRLGFVYSGLFPDPEEAYNESLPYIEAEMAKAKTDTQSEKTETNANGREADETQEVRED